METVQIKFRKGNYSNLIQEAFSDIKLIDKNIYPYISKAESENMDSMFLLEELK